MYSVPAHPNVVQVSMIPSGCCDFEFDSTYPIHLNGIINQNEFQQSINNINRSYSTEGSVMICRVIFGICIVLGIILFIVGGVTAATSHTVGFPVLIGVGFGVFAFGGLCIALERCILQSERTDRLQQAVGKESRKYSLRSSSPCSWRLDVSRIMAGGYQNRQDTHIIYRLTIEIGQAVAPGSVNAPYQSNPVAPQSTAFFLEQNSMPPPPPYYNQSAPNYCSQCGAPNKDLTATSCSSCGQVYNRY